MKKKKVLIIGGGPAGCAAANLLSELDNLDITLVEKNSFLGAGVRTFNYGGHPYTFGPRHFLTKNKDVYDYLNSIVPLRSCSEHIFLSYVEKDQNFYNFPLHYDDIKRMPESKKISNEIKNKSSIKIRNSKNFEEYWINSVGKTLYSKVIKNYTKKMWLLNDNKKLDTFNWSPKGAAIKSGGRAAFSNSDTLSAYPIKLNGYNDFFDRVLKLKMKVLLNTNLKLVNFKKKIFSINNKKYTYDIVISTISPDIYAKQKYGELKFIGRDFHKVILPVKQVFPKDVYFLYYTNDEKFTRLVEYKKFTNFKSKSTLIGMEIPSMNGKHYPLPFKKDIKLSQKYLKEMPEWFFSIGRAGTYRYLVDIDDCIEQAMEIQKIIIKNDYGGPLPLKKWWKI